MINFVTKIITIIFSWFVALLIWDLRLCDTGGKDEQTCFAFRIIDLAGLQQTKIKFSNVN